MAIEYRDGIAGKICSACKEWKPCDEFHQRRLDGVPVGDGYKSSCKDCANALRRSQRRDDPEKLRQAARTYVAKNRERVRAIKQSHRKAHPERYNEALRAYRERHRERVNTAARVRRAANLEHYRAIGRASRDKHRAQRNAASRTYAKTHPEWSAAHVRARRARKYRAKGSHTEAEWELIKAQYQYTCLCCGRREPEIILTRDHVIPLTQGGTDWITNIQPLCHSCNSSKNAQSIDFRPNWWGHRTSREIPGDQ